MRVVLYTNDMEPITVIDLSETAARYLKLYNHVRLPVMERIPFTPFSGGDIPMSYKTVDIYAELLRRNGVETLMLFTNDEENALLLKSTFLAGQQREVNNIKDYEFARGFLSALNTLGA
jgi:hypothetical protein